MQTQDARAVYARTFWASLAGQWVLAAGAWLAGARLPLECLIMAGIVSFPVAGAIGTWVSRRMKVSLDGESTEVIRDAAAAPDGARGDHAVVTRPPVSALVLFFVTAMVIQGCIEASVHWGRTGLLVAIGVGLLAVANALWRAHRATIAEVGTGGIVLRRTTGQRRLTWNEIGRCEVTTRRNAEGMVTGQWCLVFDRAGRLALKIDLLDLDPRCVPEFLDAVRGGAAPPSELIAAHGPAGTGTELVAEARPATPDESLQRARARTGPG